jgi:hypothetical protein
VLVEGSNLVSYIQAVVDATLGSGIEAQLQAFREGFNEVRHTWATHVMSFLEFRGSGWVCIVLTSLRLPMLLLVELCGPRCSGRRHTFFMLASTLDSWALRQFVYCCCRCSAFRPWRCSGRMRWRHCCVVLASTGAHSSWLTA